MKAENVFNAERDNKGKGIKVDVLVDMLSLRFTEEARQAEESLLMKKA
jgi:hypothetical protein